MSGDHLAARMDAMHEAWDAMERHVLEKFETFALGYGLDLSLNDKKQWNDPTTNAASTAFFEGYCIRHVEQKKAYDVSNVQLTADNARLRELLRECVYELMPDAYELRDKLQAAIGEGE